MSFSFDQSELLHTSLYLLMGRGGDECFIQWEDLVRDTIQDLIDSVWGFPSESSQLQSKAQNLLWGSISAHLVLWLNPHSSQGL